MLDKGVILRHYKRPEVQKAIIELAKDREVSVRYETGFGKRPDVIKFPKDVLEFAKKGVTSFHCSEERWSNPIHLSTGMNQQQLNELRIGWDLIIDIDCKVWKYSKLITLLIVSMLKKYGINSISVKFSGNKGFHIGVPFEAFPDNFLGKPMSNYFPEAPRKIALYMKYNLEKKLVRILKEKEKQEIAEFLNMDVSNVFVKVCKNCNAIIPKVKNKFEFICSNCGNHITLDNDSPYQVCEKCGKIMDKVVHKENVVCKNCGSTEYEERFDVSAIVEIDTLLISSRHMFRMAYSLHEKSGLVSLPLELNHIKDFKKEEAQPENIKIPNVKFLDTSNVRKGEISPLLLQAYDFGTREKKVKQVIREFEVPENPIETKMFPPCIKNILKGLEDGRKRAVFILQNFLSSMGWSHQQIEDFIKSWNEKNKPPLKHLNTSLKSFRKKKLPILPPNCEKTAYYKDIQICQPDNICMKIKNPAQYYKYNKKLTKKGSKKTLKGEEK